MEAIHCVDRQGHIQRGAHCLRSVGLRLPLVVPVSLILWIPGVIGIAERLYAWVSRNRYLISRIFGCKQACAVVPTRRRSGKEELGVK